MTCPIDTLVYLLGSRYCETDSLSETAWALFDKAPTAGVASRPSAISSTNTSSSATSTRGARERHVEAYQRAPGRLPGFRPPGDHLLPLHEHPRALLHRLSRRYRRATDRLADGLQRLVRSLPRRQWHTFDARNNIPRIGRILIAQGRDASDVAISTTFGPNTLKSFRVWTDEVKD